MEYTIHWLQPSTFAWLTVFFSITTSLFLLAAPPKLIRNIAELGQGRGEPDIFWRRTVLRFLYLRRTTYGEFTLLIRALRHTFLERPEEPTIIANDTDDFDYDAPPIWEVIAEVSKTVPDEEWGELPKDLSKQFDSGND